MLKGLFRCRAIVAGAAVLACSAAPAHAAGLIDPASLPLIPNTASCTTPVFSEPFAPWGDTNQYTLAPGQSVNNFTGAGWTLLTGARVITTSLANGQSAHALSLPLAGVAISPPMCVTDRFPTVRAMVDGPRGQGVLAAVLYSYHGLWGNPLAAGGLTASGSWAPSAALNIHPGPAVGWQWARFVFIGTSLTGPIRLYNFYVDPRMK
jgi:hypothetical protein